MEYGEQLIDDGLTDAEDKEKVQKDVKELGEDLKDLEKEAAKEKIRYRVLKVSACTGEWKKEMLLFAVFFVCFSCLPLITVEPR